MLGKEARQQRRQRTQCERQRRVDPQSATDLAALIGDAAFQCIEVVKQTATFVVIGLPRVGQAHAPGCPLQQHDPEVRLQHTQLLAQSRRRHAQVFGGPRQATAFDDPPKGTHQIEGIHDRSRCEKRAQVSGNARR
ncbi:hypothetical protein D3C71_1099330 [compost metagenome]